MVAQFVSEYGLTILYALFTALAGGIAMVIKRAYSEFVTDQTKERVVKTCVKAVEQLYFDLCSEEKFDKALDAASEILSSKNIHVTSLELEFLIEAAVAEFNKVFEK